MKSSLSTSSVLAIACILMPFCATNAFSIPQQSSKRIYSSQLYSNMNEDTNDMDVSRRKAMVQGFGSLLGITSAMVSRPEDAMATYSAYTNREKDWEDRQKNDGIKVSTARDLRAQLREIAPMNSEASYKFCPNGPSAAVSPLMENKCGDRLATPSVFGRTEDIAGNSIPGLANGRYPSGVPGGTASLSANPEVGGFPKY